MASGALLSKYNIRGVAAQNIKVNSTDVHIVNVIKDGVTQLVYDAFKENVISGSLSYSIISESGGSVSPTKTNSAVMKGWSGNTYGATTDTASITYAIDSSVTNLGASVDSSTGIVTFNKVSTSSSQRNVCQVIMTVTYGNESKTFTALVKQSASTGDYNYSGSEGSASWSITNDTTYPWTEGIYTIGGVTGGMIKSNIEGLSSTSTSVTLQVTGAPINIHLFSDAEGRSYDYISILGNGISLSATSNTTWYEQELPVGTYTITFKKDSSVNKNSDSGYFYFTSADTVITTGWTDEFRYDDFIYDTLGYDSNAYAYPSLSIERKYINDDYSEEWISVSSSLTGVSFVFSIDDTTYFSIDSSTGKLTTKSANNSGAYRRVNVTGVLKYNGVTCDTMTITAAQSYNTSTEPPTGLSITFSDSDWVTSGTQYTREQNEIGTSYIRISNASGYTVTLYGIHYTEGMAKYNLSLLAQQEYYPSGDNNAPDDSIAIISTYGITKSNSVSYTLPDNGTYYVCTTERSKYSLTFTVSITN